MDGKHGDGKCTMSLEANGKVLCVRKKYLPLESFMLERNLSALPYQHQLKHVPIRKFEGNPL
jgi:hypothetical protein